MIIDSLSQKIGISEDKLNSLASTASRRYKVYKIPKRNGGMREIAQPSEAIKLLQRAIIEIAINKFPLHEAARAYKQGSSITKNAIIHKDTKFTNRYDFTDFFHSFTQDNVISFLLHMLHDEDIMNLVTISDLLCRNGRLTIGAPSSPALTNAMMFEFDKKLFAHCQKNRLVYTRYADDIFVSAYEPNKLNNIQHIIRKTLDSIPYLKDLKLKAEKTAYLSKKYRRSITGIVITSDNQISVGRDRKRKIRALIHKWIHGTLKNEEEENLAYLKGLLAFTIGVEPDLWGKLCKKYGKETMQKLKVSE